MSSRTFKIAGWLAMASAFLTLPLVYLSYTLEGRVDPESNVLQTIIQVSGVLLFVALVLFLRKLLNTYFNFSVVNRNLDLMMAGEVLTGILSVAALYVTPMKEQLGYAVVVILVVQGGIQAQLGFKLLKLPDSLEGLLKPFCYANMATGILIASIILIPVGVLVSAISDLMLGTIFLNLSRVVKNRESKSISS